MDGGIFTNGEFLEVVEEVDRQGRVKRGDQDEIILGNVPRRINKKREGVT